MDLAPCPASACEGPAPDLARLDDCDVTDKFLSGDGVEKRANRIHEDNTPTSHRQPQEHDARRRGRGACLHEADVACHDDATFTRRQHPQLRVGCAAMRRVPNYESVMSRGAQRVRHGHGQVLVE